MKAKLFSAATFLFAFTVAISGLQGCKGTKSVDPSDLEGYWVLKTFNGQDAKNTFTGALPTLIFDFKEMKISGTGGCNSYSGSFSLEKDILTAPNIVSTQMLCLNDIPEHKYFIELAKPSSISVENGILSLTDSGNSVTLEFEKGQIPVEKAKAFSVEQLSGTWNLKTIEGAAASTVFGGENATIPNVTFDIEKKIASGKSGCNSYGSAFTLSGNTLMISQLAATQMVCPNLEGESKFIRNLSDTTEVSVSDTNMLIIMKGGAAVLEFEKAAK